MDLIDIAIAKSLAEGSKGQPGGTASLDDHGKVPAEQLPSYVDDITEGYYHEGKFYEDEQHTKEITPSKAVIYYDVVSGKDYRWTGSEYIEVPSGGGSGLFEVISDVTPWDDFLDAISNGKLCYLKNNTGGILFFTSVIGSNYFFSALGWNFYDIYHTGCYATTVTNSNNKCHYSTPSISSIITDLDKISDTKYGCAKVDGTTITADSYGVISAVGAGADFYEVVNGAPESDFFGALNAGKICYIYIPDYETDVEDPSVINQNTYFLGEQTSENSWDFYSPKNWRVSMSIEEESGTEARIAVIDEPVPVQISSSEIDSGNATSGAVLTADGNGGASWATSSGGEDEILIAEFSSTTQSEVQAAIQAGKVVLMHVAPADVPDYPDYIGYYCMSYVSSNEVNFSRITGDTTLRIDPNPNNNRWIIVRVTLQNSNLRSVSGSWVQSYPTSTDYYTTNKAVTEYVASSAAPACPASSDGTFTLQATVSNGSVSYEWVPA